MTKYKETKAFFSFARLTCLIRGPEKDIAYILKSYKKSPFTKFISEKEPKNNYLKADLILNIEDPTNKNSDFFRLKSNPKKLEFKLSCTQNTFFVFPVIEQVLRKIFYIMLFKDNGFVLHASAVSYNSRAIIFTGKSGSGKSTIVNILKKNQSFNIFADNNVYIKRKNNKFVVYKSPFLEWSVIHSQELNPNDTLEIASVYILNKSSSNSFGDIIFSQAASQIARQIQLPVASLTEQEIAKSRKLVFDFITQHLEKESIKYLNFMKDSPGVANLVTKRVD